MAYFVKWCMFGPQLHRIMKTERNPGRNYEPNIMEKFGHQMIKSIRVCWSVCCWISPVVLFVLYKRDFFTIEGLLYLCRYSGALLAVIGLAAMVRGIGRAVNPDYNLFLRDLLKARAHYNLDAKESLRKYDSDMWAWPVDYDVAESSLSQRKSPFVQFTPGSNYEAPFRFSFTHILSYIAANTFGRRMLFPGATGLVQTLIGPALLQGRALLIEEKNGQRAKVKTADGNFLDTMFVDNRNKSNSGNGNQLVICCEGNSGFYEVGAMVTPLDKGYSVLGWNHPGFAGSTGNPWPNEERRAIEAVLEYASQRLGFAPEDTIIYAWSIGGYAACWGATYQPRIRHMVLDATFDDVLSLAEPRMPPSWTNLVRHTVRGYLNLHNSELIKNYPGPVRLIRRTRDEMITTRGPDDLTSNRGNDLLIKLLKYRYPVLMTDDAIHLLRVYLGNPKLMQNAMLESYGVDEDFCEATFASYIAEHSTSFPMRIGEDLRQTDKNSLILFLAMRYMDDFDSTHCVPLPAAYLQEPWKPTPLER